MNLLARISIALVLLFRVDLPVYAAPPTVELLGGLSSPAPGISASGGLCWQLWHLGCGGVSVFGSRNEVTKDDVTINASFLTATLEQQFGLIDNYHLIWLNGALGVGYYRRKVNDSSRAESESWKKVAPSVGGGAGLELPIADLIGVRFGIVARKAIATGTSTQVAFVAGIKFGSEWLGVGD